MPRKSVKLVSAEGFEFTVDYRAACVSNTIKQMLSSEGMHAQSRPGRNLASVLSWCSEWLTLVLHLMCRKLHRDRIGGDQLPRDFGSHSGENLRVLLLQAQTYE